MKDLEDVDDDVFISKKPQNYIFAEKKANDINDRTTKMLHNTRSLVQESEKIGQSALENLSSQRETLERVENDLDTINSMTRATQKNLNNMRSFFGGIKSLFSSSNSNSNQPIIPITSGGLSRSATLAHMPSASTSGSTSTISSSNPNVAQSNSTLPHQKQNDDDDFDGTLNELGFGLGRLKEMASKLGEEIEDQNELVDRITNKSERAGDSIKHQNRQMQSLLKKG